MIDRGRVQILAIGARAMLNRIQGNWPHDMLIGHLMAHGLSYDEAKAALEQIEWENNQPKEKAS